MLERLTKSQKAFLFKMLRKDAQITQKQEFNKGILPMHSRFLSSIAEDKNFKTRIRTPLAKMGILEAEKHEWVRLDGQIKKGVIFYINPEHLWSIAKEMQDFESLFKSSYANILQFKGIITQSIRTDLASQYDFGPDTEYILTLIATHTYNILFKSYGGKR